MRKLWVIARSQYVWLVRRRAFLVATLGIPALIGVVIAFSVLANVNSSASNAPLGYVDKAGIIEPDEVQAVVSNGPVSLQAFTDEATARQALVSGNIQALYVVPAGYLQSGHVDLYYWQNEPGNDVVSEFDRLMRLSMLSGQPTATQQRVIEGVNVTVHSADGTKSATEQDIINYVLPFFVGMFFVFVIMAASGFLLQAVATEKENRTVEVLFTSVSPLQFVAGKALGLIGVSFTQLLIWLVTLAIGLVIGAQYVDLLAAIKVPWTLLAVVLLYFIPTFVLITGIMTTLGSMISELQQGQQIAGILNLAFMFPLFFAVLLFTNPDSPIMVVMTLFPTTAFMTVAMRWGVSAIPAWQLVTSWLILTATALASIYVAARVFRIGMLRYGQALSLGSVIALLRGKVEASHPEVHAG